jgi:hypothetical protein
MAQRRGKVLVCRVDLGGLMNRFHAEMPKRGCDNGQTQNHCESQSCRSHLVSRAKVLGTQDVSGFEIFLFTFLESVLIRSSRVKEESSQF